MERVVWWECGGSLQGLGVVQKGREGTGQVGSGSQGHPVLRWIGTRALNS